MNETQENLNTTTVILTTSIKLLLDSLWMAIVGLRLCFVKRSPNVGFSAPPATASAPSSNKGITPAPSSNQPCARSPASTVSESNANQRLQDIINARVPLDKVTLEEWCRLSMWSMISEDRPNLDIKVMHDGSLYELHSCIQSIAAPEKIKNILRKQ